METEDLLELVQNGLAGERFEQSVRSLVEKLSLQGRHADADKLRDVLTAHAAATEDDELPVGIAPLRIVKPLSDIQLDPKVARVIDEFLEEQRYADKLVAARLKARNKLLMSGPPGNGKTVLAGAIADALSVRSFIVRYDDLISERPGETSRGLKRIIDFASSEPTALFFDEFDALGVKRSSPREEGDMKRTVSTLLFQLDNVPHHVVCMAATNHPELLDPALWRRFNMRVELGRPPVGEFVKFMRSQFNKYGFEPKEGPNPGEVDYELADARMMLQNLSDAELFCENVIRHHVMTDRSIPIEECIRIGFTRWPEDQKRRSV